MLLMCSFPMRIFKVFNYLLLYTSDLIYQNRENKIKAKKRQKAATRKRKWGLILLYGNEC